MRIDTRILLKLVAGHSTLFMVAATKTHWELNKVLKAIYKIFNESPALCDVYLKEGSSSKFRMKVCETWWVEDKEVAECALEVWKSVVATVRYLESLCKSKKPKNKSFYTSVIHYQDLLMAAKLHFFAFITGILKLFLVLFQTNNLMLLFMYD